MFAGSPPPTPHRKGFAPFAASRRRRQRVVSSSRRSPSPVHGAPAEVSPAHVEDHEPPSVFADGPETVEERTDVDAEQALDPGETPVTWINAVVGLVLVVALAVVVSIPRRGWP